MGFLNDSPIGKPNNIYIFIIGYNMKRLNKLASVFCVAAMALTAMTGCEGSDMFSVNSPDWLSEKIDSIEKLTNLQRKC